jgi:hypothetical protein
MDDLTYLFQHPEEYWPILVLLGVLLVVNLLLVATGALSYIGTRRAPARGATWRLVLALVPALVGGLLVLYGHMPLQMELGNGTRKCQFDLCWSFLLPLLMGGLALVAYLHPRRPSPRTI